MICKNSLIHKLNKKTKKLITANTLINGSLFLVDTVSSLITAFKLAGHSAFLDKPFWFADALGF